jgi:hypothetical protein
VTNFPELSEPKVSIILSPSTSLLLFTLNYMFSELNFNSYGEDLTYLSIFYFLPLNHNFKDAKYLNTSFSNGTQKSQYVTNFPKLPKPKLSIILSPSTSLLLFALNYMFSQLNFNSFDKYLIFLYFYFLSLNHNFKYAKYLNTFFSKWSSEM